MDGLLLVNGESTLGGGGWGSRMEKFSKCCIHVDTAVSRHYSCSRTKQEEPSAASTGGGTPPSRPEKPPVCPWEGIMRVFVPRCLTSDTLKRLNALLWVLGLITGWGLLFCVITVAFSAVIIVCGSSWAWQVGLFSLPAQVILLLGGR